jgi:hypothetical protein
VRYRAVDYDDGRSPAHLQQVGAAGGDRLIFGKRLSVREQAVCPGQGEAGLGQQLFRRALGAVDLHALAVRQDHHPGGALQAHGGVAEQPGPQGRVQLVL